MVKIADIDLRNSYSPNRAIDYSPSSFQTYKAFVHLRNTN